MREIKFRAWDKKEKLMIPSIGLTDYGTPFILNSVYQERIGGNIRKQNAACLAFDKDEVELMQFTGLSDKNGKDIYEGDVLIGILREQKDKEGKYAYEIKDYVQWRNGGFKVLGKDMQRGYTKDNNRLYQFMWHDSGNFVNTRGWYYQIDEIEVVGNIYENPELLNPLSTSNKEEVNK